MNSLFIQLDPFLKWIITVSLHSTLLICLIFILRSVLKSKLSIRWQYLLWLLLVIRMLTPFLPQTSLSIFNLFPKQVRTAQIAPAPAEIPPTEIAFAPPTMITPDIAEPIIPQNALTSPSKPNILTALSLADWIFYLWLAGVVLFSVYLCISTIWMWLTIRPLRPLTDGKILNILEDCKDKMNIRTIVAIVPVKNLPSPVLFGFIRPRILLPADLIKQLTDDDLAHIICHELAHLKRYDICVNWLTAALQILHWFNPLIWIAFYQMRADRELAADSLVLSYFPDAQTTTYGRTIISLLEKYSKRQYLPSVAGILEDKTQLKRRIKMIANFNKKSIRLTAVSALILIAFAFVALTNAADKTETANSDLTPKQLAQNFVKNLQDNDFKTAVKQFDKTMTSAMPAAKLKQTYAAILSQAGQFKEILGIREQAFLATKIIFVTCEYENGPLDIKVVYDKENKISGLWFEPTPQEVLEKYKNTPKIPTETKTYEVNKSVMDFVSEFDLSTPENAYATINRVSAMGKAQGWKKVSTPDIAKRINKNSDVPQEWATVLKNATILKVHIYKDIAIVAARLEQEYSSEQIRSPIDLRSLQLIDGKWLNKGNDRVDNLEQFDEKFAWVARRITKQKTTKEANIKALIQRMNGHEDRPFEALNKIIKIGTPAVDELIHALKTTDNWQYAKALGAIKDKRAIEPLIEKWNENNTSPLKDVIAESLENITGQKFGDNKEKWKNWYKKEGKSKTPQRNISVAPRTEPTLAEKRASVAVSQVGWKLWGQQKFAEAEKKFQLAVQKDPSNENAWNGLGWSIFNQGDPKNATEAFEKCIGLNPKHAAALNGLGWINKNKGDTDKAIQYWRTAVNAAPTATAALSGLAQTYMEQKDYKQAAKYYQMWLKAEPNNKDAQQGLEKAKQMMKK